MAEVTRGWLNNNPGNLKHSKDPWLGKSKLQTDKTFLQFDTPEAGVRNLRKTLNTYQRDHGLSTVQDMISRFAPASDNNDPKGYAAFVADRIGVKPTDPIDVRDKDVARRFVDAIIHMENKGNMGTPDQVHATNRGFDAGAPTQRENSIWKAPPVAKKMSLQAPLMREGMDAARNEIGKGLAEQRRPNAGDPRRGVLPLTQIPPAPFKSPEF